MSNPSQLVLPGHLIRDWTKTEKQNDKGGYTLLSSAIAYNKSKKTTDGSYVDDPDKSVILNISFFDHSEGRKRSDNYYRLLKKGMPVVVTGEFQGNGTYVPDGKTDEVRSYALIVDNITLQLNGSIESIQVKSKQDQGAPEDWGADAPPPAGV